MKRGFSLIELLVAREQAANGQQGHRPIAATVARAPAATPPGAA